MTLKMDLLSLSIVVFCDVVCCRVSLKELVRLDAAFCCQNRSAWIQLLRSKQFTFNAPVDISNVLNMRWLLSRDVKVSGIEFVRKLDVADASQISKYLRTHGSSVRSVHFNGVDSTKEMNLTAINCRNLASVSLFNATLDSAYTSVLHYNPNIQHLNCQLLDYDVPNVMEGLFLHKLQSLRMVHIYADTNMGCLWHESTHSDSLHTVIWNRCEYMAGDFSALLSNCPQIRSLSHNDYAPRVSSPLANNALLMTRLINLSASSDHSLTDDAVLTLAKNLTALRTLNIRQCSTLTDRALLHLAEHSCGTLEVLYTDIKNPESKETEEVLQTFSQKCTKLRYLSVNCGEKMLCTGRGTGLLMRGCPALRTLVVNKQETICESSREFIAVMRPELKLLVHNVSTAYNILAMPI